MYWLRLAIVFGIPPAELQQRIDKRWFARLIVYDRKYGLPWPTRDAAAIQAVIANCFSSRKYSINDFMPTEKPPQDVGAVIGGILKRQAADHASSR